MKLTKIIVVFIILGFGLTLPVFNNFYYFNSQNNYEYTGIQDIFHSKNLKTSSYLTVPRIHIDGNWSYTAGNYSWCTGDGSWGNPYLIQSIKIDGDNSGSCITIQNTNDSFIISNCLLINSSYQLQYAGIKLINVEHGQVIENNCSNNNGNGMTIGGYNNTISGNIINYNSYGLQIGGSNHTISGNIINYNSRGIQTSGVNHTIVNNTINNNIFRGIILQHQSHSSIKNNTIYNNDAFGIYLKESDENTIERNEISSHDSAGICLDYCDWNIFANNTIYDNVDGISLFGSHHNDIIENTLNPNGIGIRLRLSSYNNIISNIIVYYYECIWQTDCEENYFLNNECQEKRLTGGPAIFGYDTFLVIAVISVISIFLMKKKNFSK